MPNILMPALSPTMEEGKLAKWLKKVGDNIRSGLSAGSSSKRRMISRRLPLGLSPGLSL